MDSGYFMSITEVENLLEPLFVITIQPAEEEAQFSSNAQRGQRKNSCKNRTAVEAHSLPLLNVFTKANKKKV